MNQVIKVDNLVKWYKKTNPVKQNIKALDGISFELSEGEILGVIGESGCGKSTLGKLLIKLEDETSGNIEFLGENIGKLVKKNNLFFRRNCQMIFQNPFDTFDPRQTIEQIFMTVLKIHNIGNTHKEKQNICINILEKGGLIPAKDYINRYPHELSGGQLQRISILRAMLLSPKFLVADEPVSMLDVSVRADIINMLQELTKEHKTAMVFISHDISTTRYISDKVAVMYLGKIVEIGKTDDVLHNPKHPYTKVLISNCASIDPLENMEKISISGEPPTPVNTGPGCYFEPRCYKSCEQCKTDYPKMIEIEKDHYISCFNID